MKKFLLLLVSLMMLTTSAFAAEMVEIGIGEKVYLMGDVTVSYTLKVKDTNSECGIGIYTQNAENGQQRYNFKVRDTFDNGRIDFYVAKDYANKWLGFLVSEEYRSMGWTKDCYVSVDKDKWNEPWTVNNDEFVDLTFSVKDGIATVTIIGNNTQYPGTLTFDLAKSAWLGNYLESDPAVYTEGWLSLDGNTSNITNLYIDKTTWNNNFEIIGYPNNTVCVLGPSLRDFQDPVTGKWYTVLPLDLSQNAEYTYPLIGGNCYVIGEVNVIIRNGMVNTSYKYYNGSVDNYNTKGHSEYINYFKNWEDITTEAVENLPESGYQFGKTYVAKSDFGGDEQVFLFICNRASFYAGNGILSTGNPYISRYYKDAYKNVIKDIVVDAGLETLYTK